MLPDSCSLPRARAQIELLLTLLPIVGAASHLEPPRYIPVDRPDLESLHRPCSHTSPCGPASPAGARTQSRCRRRRVLDQSSLAKTGSLPGGPESETARSSRARSDQVQKYGKPPPTKSFLRSPHARKDCRLN